MTSTTSPIDLKKLTAGELAWLEDYTGRSIATLQDQERPQVKLMIGLVYLFEKRRNPAFTVELAEALTLDELNAKFVTEADPSEGEG